MNTLSLDDSRTLQAIGILADVLDKISGPTVLDTVLVSKALRQVLATKSQPALDFASRAFMTLDPEIRLKIADEATQAAEDAVQLRGRISILTETARQNAPAKPQQGQPTGFLAALNTRNWANKGPRNE